MQDTVLIYTHTKGFESDFVIDSLRQNGLNVFRLNSDIEQSASVSVELTKLGISVIFECDGRVVSDNDIGVCWLQQLPCYSDEDSINRKNKHSALFGALSVLKCPWLNRPSKVINANNKIQQLNVAKSVGFKIPDTIVSDRPKNIRSFFYSDSRETIAKNLSTPWVVSSKSTLVAYTKKVEKSWLREDYALNSAPVIYQKFLERAKDIRVVVVGNDVYPAYTTTNNIEERFDIRRQSLQKNYKKYEIPDSVSNSLRKMLSKLQLDYCSADLVETTDGDYYFLDLNTTGAWWWVDEIYNQKIRESFVNFFKLKLT